MPTDPTQDQNTNAELETKAEAKPEATAEQAVVTSPAVDASQAVVTSLEDAEAPSEAVKEVYFSELGLSVKILKALEDKGYTQPTPIQEKAIPSILEGRDLMASAQTGTGKTAGFMLPLLERLSDGLNVRKKNTRVLILTPTRELAAQVHQSAVDYGKHLGIRSAVVFGGVKISPQMRTLGRGVDILVATPGRLMDLYGQKAVEFDQVETLVLDEADRMLDMGFLADIRRIQGLLPQKRQTLLFSATFSSDIRTLAKQMLQQPVEVDVTPKNSTAVTVDQSIYTVDKKAKTAVLCHLLKQHQSSQALVFSRTKHGANKLVKELYKQGIPAAAIHGNKSQNQRTKALAEFKDGKTSVLIATDIAARGIDIQALPLVINFDLPNVPEDYVHRIGRTGRAGSTGEAISLVCADEIDELNDIERLIGRHLTREEIEGYEAVHPVPNSKPINKNAPVRRSKKPKVKSESGGGGRPPARQRSNDGRGRKPSGGDSRSNNSSRSNTSGRSNTSSRSNSGGGKPAAGRGRYAAPKEPNDSVAAHAAYQSAGNSAAAPAPSASNSRNEGSSPWNKAPTKKRAPRTHRKPTNKR